MNRLYPLFLLFCGIAAAQPSEYKQWASFDGKASGEVPRVYANPAAMKGLRGGSYTDGAAIVWDLSAAKDASKRRIDWMVREGGKWEFARAVDGKVTIKPPDEAAAKCAACHAGEKARGGVFNVLPDWNREAATRYLDARAKQWSEWSVAKAKGGSCVSCHTTLLYLLARPEGPYAAQFRSGLQTRLDDSEQKQTDGASVEAVLAALVLGSDQAKARMWTKQIKEGTARGSFPWYSLDLDPWESSKSAYWGAALAAVAAKGESAPLTEYLRREMPGQPLHHRLLLLWAGTLNPDEANRLREEAWSKQADDGSWTVDALGPWKKEGTNATAFATAYTAFALQRGAADCADPRMGRALDWLRRNQNAETGSWSSTSMNKSFPADSMQIGFMDDAATGFAFLALSSKSCADR
ncbi:MAG: cytochrome P460 family protein [Acidobacteria bacterium]|nr:cytochrome P460 family protein [Acidobacteriota bacterium]